MATNLDPALLAQILGGGAAGYTPWTGEVGGTWQGGDAGHYVPGAQQTLIYGPQSGGSFSVQGNDVWDTQGNYQGRSTGDGDGLAILKAMAAAAAMYGGASALSGAGAGGAGAASGATEAGAGAGTGGWGDWAAAEMAGASANPATAAQLNGWAAGSGIAGAGGAGLGATAAGTGAGAGAGASGGASGSSMGSLGTLGNIAGALAGAASARDQTQSTNRDPWGPAQPLLRDLIAQTGALSQQYQQQPFSAAQQTAYGNVGGLLNALNGSAPGLLAGFGANASGANNFDRSNPRRAMTGGAAVDLSQWAPGLLQFFGRGGT